MSRTNKMMNILQLLARNVASNKKPELVDSSFIASELNLTLAETRGLLRAMDIEGVIQSNIEAEYSLITMTGLNSVNACSIRD